MLIYAVFLLSIAIGTTGGALVYGPTDQNVTVGQQVILLCATDLDLPVYWYFKGNEIFYGGKVAMSFQDRYNIFSNKTGEYNLVIPSADVSYNGEYICGDDEGVGQRKSALLYVTAETVTVAETHGSTSSSDVNLGLIIGIPVVVGIVLFIAILGVAVYFCKKCANKKEKKKSDIEEARKKLLNEAKSGTTEGRKKDESKPPLQNKTDSGAAKTFEGHVEETHNVKVSEGIKLWSQEPNGNEQVKENNINSKNKSGVISFADYATSRTTAKQEESEPQSDKHVLTSTENDSTEVQPNTHAPRMPSQEELDKNLTDELKPTPVTTDVQQPRSVLGTGFGQKESDDTPSATPVTTDVKQPRSVLRAGFGQTEAHDTPSATPVTTDVKQPRMVLRAGFGQTEAHDTPLATSNTALVKPRMVLRTGLGETNKK